MGIRSTFMADRVPSCQSRLAVHTADTGQHGLSSFNFQVAQSVTGLAAFSSAIDFLGSGVDGTIQVPRRGHGHGYVNLERAEPDYLFLVAVSEAPIMTGDIPCRRAFVDTSFLGTKPLPHGPIVEMRECVAHVLDIGQGLQVPVPRSRKDVSDDGVDPKFEQRLLFQPLCGQQLDQGESEVACINLLGADWGRTRIRWVFEPGDRQSDGGAPPRRFGDRNRVGVVGRGPLNAGRKIGHGTVIHREDMRVCILPAPCEPRIVGGGCQAVFMDLGGVMEWAVPPTPRRVLRALVRLGVIVYLAAPAVREPVVMWWVNYKTDQRTSRPDPLLTEGRPQNKPGLRWKRKRGASLRLWVA